MLFRSGQRKLGRHFVLSSFSADEVRTRPAPSSELPLGRFWWNEGTVCGYYFIISASRGIPVTNHQGCELVVDCSSSYNAIIGKPTLNSWNAITSTYHLSVKFPIEYGVGQVQGDQLVARECYLAMLVMDEQVQTMNIEEKRIVAKPTEALENIPLDENNPERCTRVGADLEEKNKKDLVQFLKKNTDVFAWSHEDMPGIDPSVITHRLNVCPFFKPV